MYLRIFGTKSTKIHDEERILLSLVRGVTSNCFWISNFELFCMVKINKNLCKPKTMAKNSLETHNSLVLSFLS
jgi:hypothetical protein